MSTPAAGRLLHRLDDVAGVVVDGEIGAPGERLRELLVAPEVTIVRAPSARADLEGRRRDSAADAPDQHPLARLHRPW